MDEITPESWIAHGTGRAPTPFVINDDVTAELRRCTNRILHEIAQERGPMPSTKTPSKLAVETAKALVEAGHITRGGWTGPSGAFVDPIPLSAVALIIEEKMGMGEVVAELERLRKLASLVTVRQAVEAGDDAIYAAGLNPYCLNEGLAVGNEQLDMWRTDALLSRLRG